MMAHGLKRILAMILLVCFFAYLPAFATVNDDSIRQFATGNGVTTAFPFTFKYTNTSDVDVYKDGVLQNSGYTLTSASPADGGTITFSVAPANGVDVLIMRAAPYTQTADVSSLRSLSGSTLENAYDRLAMQIQQLRDESDRSIKLPITDQSGASPELPTGSDGKALIWNAAGTSLENSPIQLDDATAFGQSLLDAANASAARTLLGTVIGTDVQAYSSNLTTWAGKTAPSGTVVGHTDTQTLTNKTISGASNTITNLDLTSAVTGALPVANGGTGSTSAANARTALGLAIGTNVQAYSAKLTDIAALAATDSNIIVGDGSTWVAESGATARASLGLAIGTNVQAYDAELAALAGLTSAANKVPMFSGSGTASLLDFKDEDNMASDSATAVPSQQSVKAYVDAAVGGGSGSTEVASPDVVYNWVTTYDYDSSTLDSNYTVPFPDGLNTFANCASGCGVYVYQNADIFVATNADGAGIEKRFPRDSGDTTYTTDPTNGDVIVEHRFTLAQLNNGTNDFTALLDVEFSGAEYARFSYTNGDTTWHAITADNVAPVDTDTNVAADTNSHVFKVVVSDTAATFYIDGVQVAQSTGQNWGGNYVSYVDLSIEKTAGNGSVDLFAEWARHYQIKD